MSNGAKGFLLFSTFLYIAVLGFCVYCNEPIILLIAVCFGLFTLLTLYLTIQSLREESEKLIERIDTIASERDMALELADAAALKVEPVEVSDAPSDALEHPVSSLLPPLNDGVESRINIIQIAKDTEDELLSFASAAHIQMIVDSQLEELLITAHKEYLHVMFKNIIDNSIKYMKRAGQLIITINSAGDDIFIIVKDNGRGLSEDETPYIFDKNYQGSNRVNGSGLGLAQARAIVEHMEGTIYAKSSPNNGMCIYIQLPVR